MTPSNDTTIKKEFFSAQDFSPTFKEAEVGFGLHPTDRKIVTDKANAKVAPLLLALEVARAALRRLYDETAEYIKINNLGDIHHNGSMQEARDALHRIEEILGEKE